MTAFAWLYHEDIPVALEHQCGVGEKDIYWFFLQGLAQHPDYFSFAPDHMRQARKFKTNYGFDVREFSRTHFGATRDDTPTVWTLLRKTCSPYYPPEQCYTCWTQNDSSYWCGSQVGRIYKCGGPQPGDFQFWLYRKGPADGLANSNMVIMKRVDGYPAGIPDDIKNHGYTVTCIPRTDEANGGYYMYLDIDDRIHFVNKVPVSDGGTHSYIVKVTFVNRGTDTLSLEYKDYSGSTVTKTITKGTNLGTANEWIDYNFALDDAYFNNGFSGKADFRINSNDDGDDELIHRIVVIPFEE